MLTGPVVWWLTPSLTLSNDPTMNRRSERYDTSVLWLLSEKKNSGQKETNKQTGRFSLNVTGRHRKTKQLRFIRCNIPAGNWGNFNTGSHINSAHCALLLHCHILKKAQMNNVRNSCSGFIQMIFVTSHCRKVVQVQDNYQWALTF
jgi:hypothetical protein